MTLMQNIVANKFLIAHEVHYLIVMIYHVVVLKIIVARLEWVWRIFKGNFRNSSLFYLKFSNVRSKEIPNQQKRNYNSSRTNKNTFLWSQHIFTVFMTDYMIYFMRLFLLPIVHTCNGVNKKFYLFYGFL